MPRHNGMTVSQEACRFARRTRVPFGDAVCHSSRDWGRELTYQYFLICFGMPAASTRTLAHSAQLFHALSDETRLAVLGMLRDGERCVCELQVALDAAQSRLSFHLKVLREAGIVKDRKEGRWSYYRLNPAALAEVHDLVRVLGTNPSEPAQTLRIFGNCCG